MELAVGLAGLANIPFLLPAHCLNSNVGFGEADAELITVKLDGRDGVSGGEESTDGQEGFVLGEGEDERLCQLFDGRPWCDTVE